MAKLDEETLIHELDASRTAVREALQQLRDEGLIVRRKRVGTWVAGHVLQMPLYELLSPDLEGAFTFEWTENRRVPMTAFISEALGSDSADVNLVECLLKLDDDPIGVVVCYLEETEIVMPTVARTIQEGFAQQFGRELGVTTHVIECTGCDSQTARLLRVPVGAALLTRVQTLYDVDGKPRIVQFSHFRGDRVAFQATTAVPREPETAASAGVDE